MASHPDDHDAIQGSISLPVASPIEAMSVRFPARGWNRTGAAEFGESGLGTDAFGIVPDEDEHLSCGARGDPMGFEHGRRAGCGQSLEISIMGPDFRIIQSNHSSEIVPREVQGKGAAMREFTRSLRSPFLPIYVGDDLTDEPAFVALRSGITVRVGDFSHTKARFRLRNPEEVCTFLERIEGELS